MNTVKYPERISLIEVGPRDGFQNIKTWIPTEVKLAVIDKLVNAGFKRMEITSFVHPKAIPQVKDAAAVAVEVVSRCSDLDIELIALVPNLTGAKRAFECGIKTQTFVVSVSELHNYENIKMSVPQSLAELGSIRECLPDVKLRVALATAFGCPFKGYVPIEDVLKLTDHAFSIGAAEVLLCDTIGIANPRQVTEVVSRIAQNHPLDKICLHLHDTRGMGLANTVVAMQCGVSAFETAIGGLGGCPFAPGAAGNIATEDFVNMCGEMGISTGVDMRRVLDTVTFIKNGIESHLVSHMANVCNTNKSDY